MLRLGTRTCTFPPSSPSPSLRPPLLCKPTASRLQESPILSEILCFLFIFLPSTRASECWYESLWSNLFFVLVHGFSRFFFLWLCKMILLLSNGSVEGALPAVHPTVDKRIDYLKSKLEEQGIRCGSVKPGKYCRNLCPKVPLLPLSSNIHSSILFLVLTSP